MPTSAVRALIEATKLPTTQAYSDVLKAQRLAVSTPYEDLMKARRLVLTSPYQEILAAQQSYRDLIDSVKPPITDWKQILSDLRQGAGGIASEESFGEFEVRLDEAAAETAASDDDTSWLLRLSLTQQMGLLLALLTALNALVGVLHQPHGRARTARCSFWRRSAVRSRGRASGSHQRAEHAAGRRRRLALRTIGA